MNSHLRDKTDRQQIDEYMIIWNRRENLLTQINKADIIMDKTDIIPENKSGLSTLAVDGVIYGVVTGVAMFLSLMALALLSGEAPGIILARFSGGGITSPVLGMLGHLGVSAIYGVLFGVLIWPLLTRLSSRKISGC